ncbi:universal stress protein [Bradyrhizobium manausense]|uniref:Universal stress protein UspA n=1 Tax=Bradyrhizobium manausense TaxID=989370 RepID=A0A0R3DEE6_9BRAD|nr:universal stress protein [Bradyrhizobium manausense]KRQ08343.1 universal stress protein UspA [Bradyrhizobium manausense]
MIKDVIVNLEHDVARDRARDFAISVAESFDAHIVGVTFVYVPEFPGYVTPQLQPEMLDQMIEASKKVAMAAIDQFDAAAGSSQLSAEHRLLRTMGEGAPTMLAKLVRRFDLGVFMQSDTKRVQNDALIERSLFQSGRPLIVVPYVQRDRLKLDRIVCCWDGSNTAARAINDALPLLVRATTVKLLIVLDEKTKNDGHESRGAQMADHLARHDVKVEVEVMPAPDIDVASVILSYVADCSASLIVMGGYGHARIREFILGGVTREMLKSMTVPVFMSH